MKKAAQKITAVFEFGNTGYLRAIYLNAASESDQKVLEMGLFNLLKPEKFNSLKRLFRGLTR